jgi:hypothetical protein
VTNFLRRVRGVVAAALVINAVGLASICCSSVEGRGSGGSSASARADEQICDQYGSATLQGSYIVVNNRSGSGSATQCIGVTDTGFVITQFLGENPTSGRPVGYPSVYLGCSYAKCSPGSSLPKQVSQIASATSSVSFNYVDGGSYDAAYDIYLDPAPKTNGAQQMEIMIQLNDQGIPMPAVETTTIGGRIWQVWQSNLWPGGRREIIYFAPSPIDAFGFNVLDFINDVRGRGAITDQWYLTSIFAGFECWSNCAGLSVNSFSAAVS